MTLGESYRIIAGRFLLLFPYFETVIFGPILKVLLRRFKLDRVDGIELFFVNPTAKTKPV